MRSRDRKELRDLIVENTEGVTTLRDNHFEICWTWNYGDDYWYIQHDGKVWNMDHHLKPSENQFKKLDTAVFELKRIIKAENDIKNESISN